MPGKHDEIIQIVDTHNRKIGHRPRSVMLAERLIPRASYVLVFNDREEIFLQKRTATKDIYPGHWDVAAGGVVLADESYEESARRELQEELGVAGLPLQFLFDLYYDAGGNRVWGRVFACRYNGPFVLQESEVASGRFISVEKALLLKDQEAFSPNGLEILYKLQKYRQAPRNEIFFLHGLDSSGQGTKGRFFAEHFPHVHCPDFRGTLAERLNQLASLCRDLPRVIFIGSSFGGLMATCYTARFPEQVARLILLAPALNYGEYAPPLEKLQVPTTLVIGSGDTVTPPARVIPLAEKTFCNLTIHREDDDHMLHRTFMAMPWHELLMD